MGETPTAKAEAPEARAQPIPHVVRNNAATYAPPRLLTVEMLAGALQGFDWRDCPTSSDLATAILARLGRVCVPGGVGEKEAGGG